MIGTEILHFDQLKAERIDFEVLKKRIDNNSMYPDFRLL